MINKQITLELFCGTKSFSKYHSYINNISLDFDKKFNPDICIDILEWNYKIYPPNFFYIIWASPPCTEYSTCLTTRKPKMEEADKIILKTLEIIEYFNPKYYYIENPFTGRLKNRKIMLNLPFKIIDYCSYGYNYRKRTAIWTNNTDWKPKNLCNKNCKYYDKIGKKHIGHFGTGSTKCKLIDKYSIPKELIIEIRKFI